MRVHRAGKRFPVVTIVVFSSLLISCLVILPRLKAQISIDDLVDKDFATYERLKQLKRTYHDQDEIFLVVRAPEGRSLNKREMCSVSKWIHDVADTRGDIKAIISTFGVARPKETRDRFFIRPLMSIDCADQESEELEILRSGFRKLVESPFKGTLVSDDGRDAAVLIYPAARTEASLLGTYDPKVVESLQAGFKSGVLDPHPELTASWTGDGIFQYHLHRGYETMPALNLLMSVLVLIIFRVLFGTFLSGALFLCVVFWTSLPLYAGMAVAGHPIDVLSSSLSLMIFVGAIEDFIYLTHFMRRWSWQRAYQRVILPSFCTSLTTAIGFGSLMLADLDIIRRFGMWAAIGSVIEWVMMFVLLPAVVIKFPRLQAWVRNEKAYSPNPGRILDYRPPKPVTFLLLLVFPLSYLAAGNLNVSDSPERLLHPNHEARKALDVVERSRGWRANVSLSFADHTAEDFNRGVIGALKKWPLVDQIEDPYEIQEFMTENLSESMADYAKNLLEQSVLGKRLGPRDGQSRAVVYVKGLDIVDINKMRRDTEKLCPNRECWLAGSLVSYGELGERILGTLYDSLKGSLIFVTAVIFLLSLAYRPRDFPALTLASLWGPVSLLLVFYLFRIPVTYVTSMIASIVVGLAGDNAIHFMMFAKRKGGLQDSVTDVGPAALMVTISMVTAATVFFFGYFYPMKILGLMMIIGLVLSFFGDILILKGLSKKTG